MHLYVEQLSWKTNCKLAGLLYNQGWKKDIHRIGWNGKKSIRQKSTYAPRKGLRGKGKTFGWTVTQGSEWVEPQTGHPSPRVLSVGDKPPWLPGELLGRQKGWGSLTSSREERAGAGLPPDQVERSLLLQLPPPCAPQSEPSKHPSQLTAYHSLALYLSTQDLGKESI